MQDIYDCTTQYILENQNKLYRLAYSYVKQKEAALDVVQNAICRALESCWGIKNPLALKTWMYRIVVNEALQYLRKETKETILSEEESKQLIYQEPAFHQDDTAYQAVLTLPEELKTIILLRYYEDLTLKQIAEITNTNLNTVKTRLYRALQQLKQKVEEAESHERRLW